MIVAGKVKDKSTGDTLKFANVFLSDTLGVQTRTRRGTMTGVSGNYSIDVNPGEFITASYVGYKPQTIQVRHNVHNFSLTPGVELEEAVVVGEKKPKIRPVEAASYVLGFGLFIWAVAWAIKGQ